MTKELQLVTFVQAKRLEKLGFDYNAEFCFDEGVDGKARLGLKKMPYIKIRHKYTLCPTVALALKWIRDEKKIDCGVCFFDVTSLAYQGKYQPPYLLKMGDKSLKPRTSYYTLESHETYEAAESALLDELLTILEKMK
jgi:hypothetical protein